MSVMEGEMVNITCCWTAMVGRARLTWFKNQTIIQMEMVIRPEQSEKYQSINCSTYTFPNISRRDSGIYICSVNVEIPDFATYKGKGTIITVVAREDSQDNTSRDSSSGLPVPAIIALVVVAPLLLIAVIGFFFLQRHEGHATSVIYKAQHFDSEQAETDKHSTGSSRRSYHWAAVQMCSFQKPKGIGGHERQRSSQDSRETESKWRNRTQ
ncbi:uncharacterized protein LOC133420449 [Cololabis saira]|uniref:uncharacterized protein LOC133420449 n=1 Tax=Cololabis saira TaxID=129043 RepID=UPI002AD51366|nr:uncharacterized protein LOC133420449 [Cololabis saira]